LPLLFSVALEYGSRKAQESQEGLKLNETHQLDVDTDVNLLGKFINTCCKERNRIFVSHYQDDWSRSKYRENLTVHSCLKWNAE
jgi:hypothetical protein